MPDNEDDNTEYAENEDENTESNEDFSLGDYSNEDDIPDYKLQEHNRSKEGVAEEIPFSDAVSFSTVAADGAATVASGWVVSVSGMVV